MKLFSENRLALRWVPFLIILFPVHLWSFDVTENREECLERTPTRRAFFGDLHVHTRYSFDSFISSQRNDPWDAYRYAKGDEIFIPNAGGESTLRAKLRRPLDFAAVTDHAEFLGEMNICTNDEWSFGRFSPLCMMTRSDNIFIQFLAADGWQKSGVSAEASKKRERVSVCGYPGSDCEKSLLEFWGNIQQAAEDHYDRSSECKFTTFVAYEYSDAPGFRNLHRNVIFRNKSVPRVPVSTYETGSENVPELWRRLRKDCLEGVETCDVLAIPHNPNLSGGLMFPDPASPSEANDRIFFEPIMELIQHKASSECRFDRVLGRGLDTEDELCTFEQNRTDNLSSLGVVFGAMRAPEGAPVSIDDFGRRNMVRNVLKDGLALDRKTGVNPFRLGFIGSTDTHSATPGGVEEDAYLGHLGRRDAEFRNVQDHFEDNPGGLAVVFAEENSRDSIFEAMRRRETYATSGTRPIVRFFGGFDLSLNACERVDRIEHGYEHGVPMGGQMRSSIEASERGPRFMVSALKDVGSSSRPGVDLQRIQIIKGWLDDQGRPQERVIEVVGDAENGAAVDEETCEPTGKGSADLCAVWEDESFDAESPSFYYARVLENPSCRWSTWQCQAAGVNPFSDSCGEQAERATQQAHDDGAFGEVYGQCCLDESKESFYSPVIQERAWTSPIWYSPQGQEEKQSKFLH
ncbi:MAG: hypothetical protein CL917_08620 [Deltaproteobacteria bacterium]|nr:hypothetical protein [Deltaproteobacteria bacterium]